MTSITATSPPLFPRPWAWSARKLVWYHLLPGLGHFVVYFLLVWVFRDHNIPTLLALFLAILLGDTTVSWMVLRKHAPRTAEGIDWQHLFPWEARLGFAKTLGWGLLGLVLALAMMGVSSAVLEPILLRTFFSWVPDWFLMSNDPAMLAGVDRTILLVLWAASFLAATLGGATQELYHRGFLLPRSTALGNMAFVFNAALFAISHLVTPWGWVGFFLVSLPWAALMWWKRSLRVVLVAHVGMLLLMWLGMTAMLFGLTP